uniref:Uncharacterized protein n=1 Tax=Heterorhabditis bacteriophora TaxID=37862 RepID=A0A1I7WD44_HETBA
MAIVAELSIGRVWQQEGERNGGDSWSQRGTDPALLSRFRMTYTTRPPQDVTIINKQTLYNNIIISRSCRLLIWPEFQLKRYRCNQHLSDTFERFVLISNFIINVLPLLISINIDIRKRTLQSQSFIITK